jgi:hypothetical protein
MTRRADPKRIFLARRDAIRNVIIQSRALDPDVRRGLRRRLRGG